MLGWVRENRRSKNTKNKLLVMDVFHEKAIWEGLEWWEHGASLFLSWTGQVSIDSEIRKEDNQCVVAESNKLQNRVMKQLQFLK